jgi:hypothetical protein
MPPRRCRRGQRVWLLVYVAIPLLLFSVAATYNGFIALPTVFFPKNRLHLTAAEVAKFSLIVSIPLMLGIVFGFIRDRWRRSTALLAFGSPWRIGTTILSAGSQLPINRVHMSDRTEKDCERNGRSM